MPMRSRILAHVSPVLHPAGLQGPQIKYIQVYFPLNPVPFQQWRALCMAWPVPQLLMPEPQLPPHLVQANPAYDQFTYLHPRFTPKSSFTWLLKLASLAPVLPSWIHSPHQKHNTLLKHKSDHIIPLLNGH